MLYTLLGVVFIMPIYEYIIYWNGHEMHRTSDRRTLYGWEWAANRQGAKYTYEKRRLNYA